MVDAPAVKPWGIDDKKKLQQLIDNDKVDISRSEDIDYVDSIRFKYYRKRDNVNVRRNFWNYACSIDIEEHYQGYRAHLAAGGIVYCRVCLLFYYLSNDCHPVRSLNHKGRRQQRDGAQRNGGSVVAAARRLRRWRQHNSATSAAAWRRHGGSGSICGAGGSATARR
jgi:hypothetical protein